MSATESAPSIELSAIQEFLLRPRTTPYFGTHFAIRIDTAAGGRTLLKRLLPRIDSVASGQKNDNWLGIALSYEGLKALEVPQTSLDSFPEAFREGMAARAQKSLDIGINDPKNWIHPFDQRQLHIAISVFSENEAAWEKDIAYAHEQLKDLEGVTLLNSNDFGGKRGEVNPFGYKDGFTTPAIAGLPYHSLNGQEHAIAAGEFILGYPGETGEAKPMPQPEVLGKNGSYLVLRRYKSLVGAFNDFLRDNADTSEEQEWLAAKLVGRWRSGAPLALSPDKDEPELGADNSRNDKFDYADDPHGYETPRGAHMRRVNPRQSKLEIMTDVHVHRILRNGTAFGPAYDPTLTAADDATEERGIYFMLISAKACETFEFLQQEWIEKGDFQGLSEERDPILAQQPEDATFTIPKKPVRRRIHGIDTFNILQGGEYLFIPSLPALQWLAESHSS